MRAKVVRRLRKGLNATVHVAVSKGKKRLYRLPIEAKPGSVVYGNGVWRRHKRMSIELRRDEVVGARPSARQVRALRRQRARVFQG